MSYLLLADHIRLAICIKVACALLMSGENLDNFVAVKDILVQMGIYFQVQVIILTVIIIKKSKNVHIFAFIFFALVSEATGSLSRMIFWIALVILK